MAKYRTSLALVVCELIGKHHLSVTETCRLMQINRKTFYRWYHEKPHFHMAIDQAYAQKEKQILHALSKDKISVCRKMDSLEHYL